jgi:hypothetical protein
MEALVFWFAVELAILSRGSLEYANVLCTTSLDKSDSSKGKMGRCVKLVSGFNWQWKSQAYPDGEVIAITVDADKSGDTSDEVGASEKHYFSKLLLKEARLCGITTDSGGDDTLFWVAKTLLANQLLVPVGCLVGSCTLHNLNLEMAVPMKKYLMGASRETTTNKKIALNVEQLLYSLAA